MKYVWLEQNTYPVATWALPAFERYAALGFTPIVTTSPGAEYIGIIEALPETVIYSPKFSNAILNDIGDETGWTRIYDGVERYISLRARQAEELGQPAPTVTIIPECETLFQRMYWNRPESERVRFLQVLRTNLQAMPANVRWWFYPGFGRDGGITDWYVKLEALIKTVQAALGPRVQFTDAQYSYRPICPTWSTKAGVMRDQLTTVRTLSLIYTDTFTFYPDGPGEVRLGWKPDQLPDLLASMERARRIAVLYPGGQEAQFTAPLTALEAVPV